jgi:hypothetical protein
MPHWGRHREVCRSCAHRHADSNAWGAAVSERLMWGDDGDRGREEAASGGGSASDRHLHCVRWMSGHGVAAGVTSQ